MAPTTLDHPPRVTPGARARTPTGLAQVEAQIDSIVYSLFDLAPDEITLLESVV